LLNVLKTEVKDLKTLLHLNPIVFRYDITPKKHLYFGAIIAFNTLLVKYKVSSQKLEGYYRIHTGEIEPIKSVEPNCRYIAVATYDDVVELLLKGFVGEKKEDYRTKIKERAKKSKDLRQTIK